MDNHMSFSTHGKMFLCNRPISQIPQCASPISHNAPFCCKNVHMCAHFYYVHISVTKWCIVRYPSYTLWDLWDGSIATECKEPGSFWISMCTYSKLVSAFLWWDEHAFMMTSSNRNIFQSTGSLCGEIPSQRPLTRSFGVFFDLRLNIRLSKQSWGWWFETPLWRHCKTP